MAALMVTAWLCVQSQQRLACGGNMMQQMGDGNVDVLRQW